MARRLSTGACLGLVLAAALVFGPVVVWSEETPVSADLLAQALAHDHAAIAQWSADTLGQVCVALVAQDKGADAAAACVDWVMGTDQYKSATVDQLAAVVPFLGSAGDAGAGARQRVIEYIQTSYLANVVGTRAVSAEAWQTFAKGLSQGLSDTGRAAWVAQIRAAYVDDAAAFLALNLRQVQSVAGALKGLGYGQADAAVARWVDGTTSWQSASASDLASLAGNLSAAGDAGQSARVKLAACVGTKVFVDATSVRSAGPQAIRDLVVQLSKDLSAETKAAWASKVRAAYVDDAAALAALKVSEIRNLADTLKGLGDGQANMTVARWMGGTTVWQTASASDLSAIADNLFWAGDAGQAARAALAALVGTRFFADAASVRAAGPGAVAGLARSLSKELTAETKASWASKVRAAYVDDAATLAALKLGQVQGVAGALKSLGDAQADTALVKWMDGTTAWQSLPATDMASLAANLSVAGDAGRTARVNLAAYVGTKYLADAASARSAGTGAIAGLVQNLSKDLPAETKAAWASTIRAAYVDDTATLSALKLGEIQSVSAILEKLGDAQCHAAVAKWVDGTTVWQSASVKDLTSLAENLSAAGEAGQTARGKVAAYVGTKYLADAASVRSAGPQTIKDLAGQLSKDLSAETKASWAVKVRAAYVDDAATLSALKLGEIQSVSAILEKLGDAQCHAAVAKWVDGTTAWQSASVKDLASLAENLLAAGEAGQTARGKVAAYVGTKYLADAASVRSAGVGTITGLVSNLSKDLSAETKASWASKVRAAYVEDAAALSSLKLPDIRNVAETLKKLGDGQANVAVAQWVDGTTVWQSASVSDLAAIVDNLFWAGDAGRSARGKLTAHVATKYLVDAASVRAAGAGPIAGLIQGLSKDLPLETKTSWASKVRAAYVDDGASLSTLNLREIGNMVGALKSLGDAQADTAVVKWMEVTTAWRSASATNMASLAANLSAAGEAGRTARVNLAAVAGTKYLADAATVRSVDIGAIAGLAHNLSKDLSEETRAAWAASVRAAYVDNPDLVLGLRVGQLSNLWWALAALGDGHGPYLAATLVQIWTTL